MSDRLDSELYDGPGVIRTSIEFPPGMADLFKQAWEARAEVARLRALARRLALDPDGAVREWLTEERHYDAGWFSCPFCDPYVGRRDQFDDPAGDPAHEPSCPWLEVLSEASKENP